MEVILRETVQHLGAAGDVVKVKDGYARNYLLPKGLAYPATEANKKKIAYEAERIARQRADEKNAAETEATRIAEVRLSFAVKVGEEDKLYGSVTAGDVQRKRAPGGAPRRRCARGTAARDGGARRPQRHRPDGARPAWLDRGGRFLRDRVGNVGCARAGDGGAPDDRARAAWHRAASRR